MRAQIIDGRLVAATVRAAVAAEVAELTFQPRLAVVLVGDDPASTVYVRNKDRAATAAGIATQTQWLSADIDPQTLYSALRRLNEDREVDGILLQLPLPKHIDSAAALALIDPAKDVDGFHLLNIAKLAAGGTTAASGLLPCTPRGIITLLRHAGVELAGAHALVLGRSMGVGRPLAALLLAADATVTVAHSRSIDLASLCRQADILVAAVGRPELVRGDWIKPGATVIDVGINRLGDGRLVGDVAFEEATRVAGAISPVPGGVGPMTIASLLENTVTAARRRRRRHSAAVTKAQRQLAQAFAAPG